MVSGLKDMNKYEQMHFTVVVGQTLSGPKAEKHTKTCSADDTSAPRLSRCAFMHELCLPLELLLSNAIAISPPPLSLQPQARGESHCIRRLGLANHTLHGDRHI